MVRLSNISLSLSLSLLLAGVSDSAVESGGAFHGQIGRTKENRTQTLACTIPDTKGKAARKRGEIEGQGKQQGFKRSSASPQTRQQVKERERENSG